MSSVEREGDALRVTATMRNVEGAQALDVELRAWTLVTVDAHALEGASSVAVRVDGEDARPTGGT